VDLSPGWVLESEGLDVRTERALESRFALSNGYLGVRSSLDIPSEASTPRTYVSGFFDALPDRGNRPALVPVPGWLEIDVEVDGKAVSWDDVLAIRRRLDMLHGVLVTDASFRLRLEGVLRLRTVRFVSLKQRELAVQLLGLSLDRPACLRLSRLAGGVSQVLTLGRQTGRLSIWSTQGSGLTLAVARHDEALVQAPGGLIALASGSDRGWSWGATPETPAVAYRLAGVAWGRERSAATRYALAAVRAAQRKGIHQVVAEHARAWTERWAASDIVIEGDAEAQLAARFAIYHLNSAADPGN
jgi:trehalose/maltose hydrolase-like predicted phosphorylase